MKLLKRVSLAALATVLVAGFLFVDRNALIKQSGQSRQVAGITSVSLPNKFCDNPADPNQQNCGSFIPDVLAAGTGPYQNVSGDVAISGNVGIGTTDTGPRKPSSPAPIARIAKSAGLTGGPILEIRNYAGGDSPIDFIDNIGNIRGNIAYYAARSVSDPARFVINQGWPGEITPLNTTLNENGGNVGIGTATPTNKLDISSGLGTEAKISVGRATYAEGNTTLNAGTYNSGRSYFRSGWDDNFRISTFDNTPNPNFDIGIGDGAGGLSTIWLHGDLNGSVGIGTGTPIALLTVGSGGTSISAVTAQITYNSDTTDALRIQDLSATRGRTWLLGHGIGLVNAFQIYDQNAGAARLAIDTSGNVGIGTRTPGEKLEVTGGVKLATDVTAQGFTIWGANAAAGTSCTTACGNGMCMGAYPDQSVSKISCSAPANLKNCMCAGRK